MIGTVVTDLIETTRANLERLGPETIDDVRRAGATIVRMSPGVFAEHEALKRFLKKHLYTHEKKLEMTREAERIIRELFEIYFANAAVMPAEFARRAAGDAAMRARAVADYIAGMTDRYAIAEHERLGGRA